MNNIENENLKTAPEDSEHAETSPVVVPIITTPAVAKTSENAALSESAVAGESVTFAPRNASGDVVAIGENDGKNDGDVERQMRQMSRRSFLSGALAVGAAYGGWRWLATRRPEGGIPWPLRRNLDNTGQLALDFQSSTRLAPTFARWQVSAERVNGDIGLGGDFDTKDWALNVGGLASGEILSLSLNDIKALPRVEMTTELKCIEGWSIIVNWAGARFSDFAAKYPPATQSGETPDVKNKPQDLLPYAGLTTPDGGYYVGMDMQSALHPQTLLCYEMNGKPLTLEHGAPLRLVTPIKYGIKHIKRIGSIEYATNRPADYWAEQGYDWYSAH
jgi:DMSO/TMAO reductase YedYZ molybdopterin-dependent catalytic subunit